MSTTRKLLVFVVLVVGCVGSLVSPASAQDTEVEVVDEANQHTACNPCDLHAEGESHIVSLVSGSEVSTCEDEYAFTLYHNGDGEVEWIGVSHGAPGCNITNCLGGESHWAILNPVTEVGGEVEHLYIRFCYRAIATGAEFHCDGEMTLFQTATQHVYELQATLLDGINCPGRRIELGAITEYIMADGDDNVELEHHVE